MPYQSADTSYAGASASMKCWACSHPTWWTIKSSIVNNQGELDGARDVLPEARVEFMWWYICSAMQRVRRCFARMPACSKPCQPLWISMQIWPSETRCGRLYSLMSVDVN
jgi:hypothetical protein